METRTFKFEGERIDHILHYEKVFGKVSERREGKCCGVLIRHRHKVKGEQVITLQMAQQLKTKNINVAPGQLVVSVKLIFFQRQTHCIDDQDKVQSVTDTDNEFTECQTRSKELQSIGISLVSLHTFMKTLKSDFSEAYNVQADCLKIQSLILMIKMI